MKNMHRIKDMLRHPAPRVLGAALTLALCFLLVLTGCQNPLQQQEAGGGAGTVSFSLDGQDRARTIIPPHTTLDDFVRFELAFTPYGGGQAEYASLCADLDMPDGTGTVELGEGIWDMVVTAFIMERGAELVAARSSPERIVMYDGAHVERTVVLLPAEGIGAFSWDIELLGGGIASLSMEILRYADESLYRGPYYLAGGTAPIGLSGYLDGLSAGRYLVEFRLSDGEASVRATEVLRVYAYRTSHFEASFSDGVFAVSLLYAVLDAWDGGAWDFDGAGIEAGHFAILGIRGLDDGYGYFADGIVGWFDALTYNGGDPVAPGYDYPYALGWLKALADAALIGVGMEAIGAGTYGLRAEAEGAVAALIRNYTPIAISWPNPYTMAVQVGVHGLEIPLDYAVHEVFFTVTFAGNGHSAGTLPDPMVVGAGMPVQLPDGGGFSRIGHAFGGWNTNAGGTGYGFEAGADFTPTGNITLYALWLLSWNAASNSTTDTTAININFPVPVPGLTAQHITVTNETGVVTTGELGGAGAAWYLELAVISIGTGNVSVSIDMPGIDGLPRAVQVFRPPVPWTASVSGSPSTTAIEFEFDGPIVGLAAGDISLDGGAAGGFVVKGDLSGDGTSWSLAVSEVVRVGEIFVSIPRAGIESRTETLEITAITWTATAYGGTETTAIEFVFSEAITWLTSGDIAVTSGAGLVTTGVVTGSGTSWRLPVTVTRAGNISVSVSSPGVESGSRMILVLTPMLVSAGNNHTVAIINGSLRAWGANTSGRTGLGLTTGNTTTPTQVGAAWDWAYVSAGGPHTVAIRTDGSLWAWGFNTNGQLGDGTTTQRTSPTRIGTATDWVHVSAGQTHTTAIRADGSLWVWGSNTDGRTGLGLTTGNTTAPTRIGTATDWVHVSAGYSHTVAIRTDGSLWACRQSRSFRPSD